MVALDVQRDHALARGKRWRVEEHDVVARVGVGVGVQSSMGAVQVRSSHAQRAEPVGPTLLSCVVARDELEPPTRGSSVRLKVLARGPSRSRSPAILPFTAAKRFNLRRGAPYRPASAPALFTCWCPRRELNSHALCEHSALTPRARWIELPLPCLSTESRTPRPPSCRSKKRRRVERPASHRRTWTPPLPTATPSRPQP